MMRNAGLIPSTVYAFRACCKVPSFQALNLKLTKFRSPTASAPFLGSKRQSVRVGGWHGQGLGAFVTPWPGTSPGSGWSLSGVWLLGYTILYQRGDAFRQETCGAVIAGPLCFATFISGLLCLEVALCPARLQPSS